MSGSGSPSNMTNFSVNEYGQAGIGLNGNKANWCVKPGSIYTNKDANFQYFSSKCGDPYTYYAYWYRRFPNQTKYLKCYNLPYRDVLLKNKYGYVNSAGNCKQVSNPRSNVVDGGFRYYDTKINYTK